MEAPVKPVKSGIGRQLQRFHLLLRLFFQEVSLFTAMKLFHLIPLLGLSINFSGKPLPVSPRPVVAALASTIKSLPDNENEKIVSWKTKRKLAWEDFLSEPKKEGDAVASTSTSLGLSYQVRENQLTYHITCDFSKEKSWGSLKTEYILAHEQAHFDITEIHARKLYEALHQYEFNPVSFKTDISAIYNQIVKEKEDMQKRYDGETDHSRRRGSQMLWLDSIERMLVETETFSTYP